MLNMDRMHKIELGKWQRHVDIVSIMFLSVYELSCFVHVQIISR